ncbi:MAG: class I SAM-dependent methyltransferase, partial [Bacteroidota bacterium]
MKCRHCGLVQVYPLPSPDDLEKMYPVDYQGTLSDWEFERQQPLLSIIDKKNYASILDYGCGNGALVKILLERGKKVEGVEFNPQLVEKLNASRHQGIFFTVDTFHQKDKQYDLIVLDNVLEHLTNPSQIIDHLKEKLVEGGSLLVRGPHEYNPSLSFYLRLWLFGLRKSLFHTRGSHAPRHVTLSSYHNLKNFLEGKGFHTADYQVEEFHWPFPSSWEAAPGPKGKLKYLLAELSRKISSRKKQWGNAFTYVGGLFFYAH